MKKSVISIIGLISFFAIQLANAQCHPNTYYYGQIVTYCEWNNSYDSYYSNSTGISWYNNYQYSYPQLYNSNSINYNNSYYDYSYDYDYCDYNYCDLWNRTKEENYYNTLYLNNLGWPGEDKTKKEDYFKKNIIWKDKEIHLLNAINIKPYAFRYSSNTVKYNDTKRYIEALKAKIKDYYLADKISYYKMNTIINDFDYLVYNLNMQFQNTKIYDSTWNIGSRDTAQEYSDIVRTSYDRLIWNFK